MQPRKEATQSWQNWRVGPWDHKKAPSQTPRRSTKYPTHRIGSGWLAALKGKRVTSPSTDKEPSDGIRRLPSEAASKRLKIITCGNEFRVCAKNSGDEKEPNIKRDREKLPKLTFERNSDAAQQMDNLDQGLILVQTAIAARSCDTEDCWSNAVRAA